ncbi:molybdenum ABC transporter ATP-binding protein [Frigidibacter sp. RF13]|uniref:molybdenum ABC transporter ATP-binding protein n=1 Tax=Frigidibacter sp. RF13 TaxID=2997340 RepID=UPI0022703BA5|nr:molybdenum ABC transporter ATP-binding protein [Frigidibacter sp. RF13]MCY1127155.1 molybdenum ABC transporter ATP-binding protein [Frigidibacter sp. RF13]
MTDLHLAFRLPHGPRGIEIDLTLPDPGLTAIFGPSGAGKSSILRAVAGFERTGGLIRYSGETWEDGRAFTPPHRRRVGMVFQAPRLFDHLDVEGNLTYAARRAGCLNEVRPMADKFGLTPLLARKPATLSGGEAQRVALVRTLLSRPRLLLMDEPLSALDTASRAAILPLIEQLRDEAQLPILYVSHSLAEVARLATRTIALAEGRVQAQGPTAGVLSDPRAARAFGAEEPGSLIEARYAGTEPQGLCRLSLPEGQLILPALQPEPAPGEMLRLVIRARDVMVATIPPLGLSALNILPARVTALTDLDAASVDVQLTAAGTALRARLTRRSVETLKLAPGAPCHAIVKSVALARD